MNIIQNHLSKWDETHKQIIFSVENQLSSYFE